MKKKLIFILLLIAGSFCFAETLDGVYGVKIGTQIEDVLKQFNNMGWEINSEYDNFCILTNSEHKTYGGIKVVFLLVEWDDLEQMYSIGVYFDNDNNEAEVIELLEAMSKKFDLKKSDDTGKLYNNKRLQVTGSVNSVTITDTKLLNERLEREKNQRLSTHSGDDF